MMLPPAGTTVDRRWANRPNTTEGIVSDLKPVITTQRLATMMADGIDLPIGRFLEVAFSAFPGHEVSYHPCP
jgi:hypothetical protein